MASKSGRVLFNSSILVAQQVIVNLLSIVVIAYMARVLGQEDYGIYSLAFAFPIIFSSIGHFGLRALTIREVANNREKSKDYLGIIVPARIFFSFCMGLVIMAFAYLFGYSTTIIYAILITTVSFVFESLSRIIVDVFQGMEQMGGVAIRDISVRIFTGILSLLLLYKGYGLYEVCAVYALGSLFGLLINIYLYFRRFGLLKFTYDLPFIIANIKEGYPFMIIGFATIFFIKTDIIVISKMLDTSSVGVYNAAANLFYRLNFVCDAIATATFPAIANLYLKNNTEANKVLSNSVKYSLIMSLPMCVGGFMLSEKIINLIYGDQYQGAVMIFSLLICGTPLMFFMTLFNYSIGAIKKQKFVMVVLIGMSAVNLIFNFLLIPLFGILGAAIATLSTQGITLLIFSIKVFKNFHINISLRVMMSIVTAVVVMGAGLIMVKEYPLFISIPAGATLYLVVLLCLSGPEIQLRKLVNPRSAIK